MTVGGGRIAFAHVEQTIDFPSMEGVKRYVKRKENRNDKIYYLDKDNYPNSHFNEEEHVTFTTEGYTIRIWLPYNGLNMGC